MANRPIFCPLNEFPYVHVVNLEFEWYPGFSFTQAQKSISSLHKVAARKGIYPVLEISSKSPDSFGVALSAFNLLLKYKTNSLSVECAFQGSKVFNEGGPYIDLYNASSKEAKTDVRLKNSGSLINFNFFGEAFPTKPITAFYDWLYITALSQNTNLSERLEEYRGFSDIIFNPKKSINCQARAAALYVSLKNNGYLYEVIKDKNYYLSLISQNNIPSQNIGNSEIQSKLF